MAGERLCEDCPEDEKLSPRRVFDQSVIIMRVFLKQLYAFTRYEVVTALSEEISVWAHPNQIEATSVAEGYLSYGVTYDQVGRMMDVGVDNSKIFEQYNLSAYGFVGCTKRVRLSICDPTIIEPEWDYLAEGSDSKGVVICEVC